LSIVQLNPTAADFYVMKTTALLLTGLISVLQLCSCTTMDPGLAGPPARPHVPQVTMPYQLDQKEQSLIGEVERALENNGLRPTDRPGVEYELTFSVEEGPVNTDVTIDLLQGRARVARGYARAGGALKVFQRREVLRQAFDRALQQFESQLPRGGGRQPGGYDEPGRSEPYRGSDSIPQQPTYDGGRPAYDPYGSPQPMNPYR
jgi:hypothetical protein